MMATKRGVPMRNLMPIGSFSRVTSLSPRALRIYDDMGLLKPARTDPETGYRGYSLIQAVEAERIRLLRELGMPLEEIREFLNDRDPASMERRLEERRSDLRGRIESMRRALALLEDLTIRREAVFMGYEVKVREFAPQRVMSIRVLTTAERIAREIGETFGRLCPAFRGSGARLAGPAFCLYHCTEYDPERIDCEACIPFEGDAEVPEGICISELPGCRAAATLHAGPYENLSGAYGALAQWIADGGFRPLRPIREIYLVGPDGGVSPEEYRTEAVWPFEEIRES
jgi:DNA-binding transcriptional MerR regulator